MIAQLVRALAGALAAGVLPGYFWAGVLCRCDGLAERLAYSTAVSMASVPAAALVLAKIAATGVTLPVALISVVAVAGSGLAASRRWGGARAPAGPVLPLRAGIADWRALALAAVGLCAALAPALGVPVASWLRLATLAALLMAGLLAASGADQTTATAGRSSVVIGQATRVAWRSAPGTDWPGAATARARLALRPARAVADPAVPAAVPGGRASAEISVPSAGAGASAAQASGRILAARPSAALRGLALLAVLALTELLGYAGVVRHDWPYLRGQDMFSHAVMAEQMLVHGSYSSYLVYPPGFATLTAVICRFTGLQPLVLYPVAAPSLLLLAALGAYALATRLWGSMAGLAAAALAGLVLVGPYASFGGGLYPDLVSAFFLIVIVVCALVALYHAPSVRTGALVALTGGSVVLYHSVASLYLVLLLAAVALTCLPYLLAQGARGRELARALLLSLAALGGLAFAYAWYVYDLGRFFGAGGTARATVALDVGSQAVLPAGDVLAWVGSPVVWLGVLGVGALAVAIRRFAQPAQVAAALTVLAWCATMYFGSRTVIDGFPQRFERDVGAPLAVLAAFGLCLIVRSVRLRLAGWAGIAVAGASVAATVALIVGITLQYAANVNADGQPSREVLTRQEAAAGEWLWRHNHGGNIISTPDLHRGLTNRAVLAMGGYTGLQSYDLAKIRHPRSLPTGGLGPLLDSRYVLMRPATCGAARIVASDDVRYIVLYRRGNEADFAAFRSAPSAYRQVFENSQIVIYQPVRPSPRPCATAPRPSP